MSKQRKVGLALIVLGVLGNNYAYLHDLLYSDYQVIWLGPLARVAAALSVALLAAGVGLLLREGRH